MSCVWVLQGGGGVGIVMMEVIWRRICVSMISGRVIYVL